MGKAWKKKYRKKAQEEVIEMKDLEHKNEYKQRNEISQKFVDKNIDKLYTISKEKSLVGTLLSKKIQKENTVSKNEERLVKKIQKKLEKQKNHQKQKEDKVDFFEDNFDIWEKKIIQKQRPKFENKLVANPAVIKPKSSESYNPTQQAYEQKLQELVEQNDAKYDEKKYEKKNKKRIEKKKQKFNEQMKVQRLKNMTQEERLNHQIAILEAKKKKDQQKNDVKIKEQLERLYREQKNRLKQKQKLEKKIQEQNKKIQSGEIKDYKVKLSKYKLPQCKEYGLKLPQDLPDNLNQIETSLRNNVREKYDSIFRRGIIEYKPGTKAHRKGKVKIFEKR